MPTYESRRRMSVLAAAEILVSLKPLPFRRKQQLKCMYEIDPEYATDIQKVSGDDLDLLWKAHCAIAALVDTNPELARDIRPALYRQWRCAYLGRIS